MTEWLSHSLLANACSIAWCVGHFCPKPYPVLIVVYVEAFVRPDVELAALSRLLGGWAHKAPHWQLINEELVPADLRTGSPSKLHAAKPQSADR